jgi:Na+/proline symporter
MLTQVALSFNGMVGGVTLGLFSLGMFVPWANAKGAISGAIVSLVFVVWIGLGAQVSALNGQIHLESKATSIDKCLCLNETIAKVVLSARDDEHNEAWFVYKVGPTFIAFDLTSIILIYQPPIKGSFHLSRLLRPSIPTILLAHANVR